MSSTGWNIFITMVMIVLLGFMGVYYFTIRIPTYATGEICLAMTHAKECAFYDCVKEDDSTDLHIRLCGFFGGTGWYETARPPVYKSPIDFRDNTIFPKSKQ